MFETQYTIELPVYEGPLDLLLDLINRAELDITKIALAQVTDQYLAYLRRIPEHGLADLSSFLVIAARLLLIKSEALLPRPPQREVGEEDPGDALARQLLAYKKYKEVALLLGEREGQGLRTYLRIAPPPSVLPQLDLTDFDLNDLFAAFIEAMENRERPSLKYVVTPPRISIRDRIALIIEQIGEHASKNIKRFNDTLVSQSIVNGLRIAGCCHQPSLTQGFQVSGDRRLGERQRLYQFRYVHRFI